MDVRMPDGVIVRNVPDGISKEELLLRYNRGKYGGAEVGPLERGQVPGAGAAQAAMQAQEIERQTPAFQRFAMNAEQHAPILLGGAAGALSGPAGWIAGPTVAGLVGGGGELARQRMAGEPPQPMRAAEEAGKQAGGGIIAGGILKGLGMLAGKLFRTPLSASQKTAATFAREQSDTGPYIENFPWGPKNEVPFPLYSAAPGSGASRMQTLSEISLPGNLKTVSDANRVTQYINRRVGTFTEKVDVFDDAVRRGQAFFDNLVTPGKEGTKRGWTAVKGMAAENPIPIPNTLLAVREARDSLVRAGGKVGEKGNEFLTRLDTFLAQPDKVRTAIELDSFSGLSAKQGFKAGTQEQARIVQDAIEADVAAYARSLGMDDVATTFEDGIKGRAAYRKLSAAIPEIDKLAGELGSGGRSGTKGTIDWMNTLFTKGNGKALAKLREIDKDLYHDLADAWLAREISKFTSTSSETMLRSFKGPEFRNWFVQNVPKLREFMTKDQLVALDNFSLYASFMSGAQTKAAKGIRGDLFVRGAGEAVGMWKKPLIFLPTQASAFLLARGLSDPSSALFKAFTEGFSPQFRSFILKSGQLTGQAAGHGAAQ